MIEQKEKRIALDDNSIQVGEEKHIIHGNVNLERYVYLDELVLRGRFGVGWIEWHRKGQQWTQMKNAGKGFEADVMMQNMLDGTPLRKANKQHSPEVLICTLFICPETEDRTTWNEEAANEKIKLWSKEGFPAEDFTRLGLLYIERYYQGLNGGSQTILEAEAER